jgi:hypothetical protein
MVVAVGAFYQTARNATDATTDVVKGPQESGKAAHQQSDLFTAERPQRRWRAGAVRGAPNFLWEEVWMQRTKTIPTAAA